MIGQLDNYGVETDDKFKPNLCSDISITINTNGSGNGEKDKEQDDAIEKKANISDVNDALGKVTDAINKNVDNINSLSGQVSANTISIQEIKLVDEDQNKKINDLLTQNQEQEDKLSKLSDASKIQKEDINRLFDKTEDNADSLQDALTKNNEQDEKLLELSGKVQTSINMSNIAAIESAITESLKSDIYTKCECDDKFATKNDLHTFSNKFVDTFSAYTVATDNRLDGLESKYADINNLNTTVANHSNQITQLIGNKVEKNEFDLFKSDNEHNLDTLTNKLNSKADKAFVDTENAKLRADIDKNKEDIVKATTDFNNKANIEDVNKLTAKVNDFNDYVHSIANNKVEKSDLQAVSGKVDTLSDTVNLKADKDDLKAVSASVAANATSIDNLSNTKQEKGDYVLASKLNDYYKKNETSGSTEIENALNGKQDKGDYVLASKLNDYYKKNETIDLDVFNDYTGNVNTTLSTKANKDYVDQLNSKITAVETGTTKVTDDLSKLTNDIHSNYATNDYVNHAVDGITTGITNNNELIAKISDVNNLKLYDKATGQFINNGNGVLDVLHRKFHLLIKGLDESDTNLDSYLSKLSTKVTDVSDNYPNLEKRVKALETEISGMKEILDKIIGES